MDDRELDVRVAEALGWTPRTVSEYPLRDGTFVVYDGPNGECMQPGGGYFTDMGHAMTLFRDANKHGMHMVITAESGDGYEVDAYYPICDECKAPHVRQPNCYVLVRTFEELPEAICRAFLKAKGE